MPYLKPLLLLLLFTLTLTANIPPPTQSTTYDLIGNLSTITHANNTKEHYSYDDLNRLTSLIHKKSSDDTTLASFSYTLSPIGERTKIEELTRATSYSYDDLSRVLTEEITDRKNGDYSSTYTYDEVSNRVQTVIDGVTTQYTYDNNNRLLQQGGTLYTYDDNGNTLTQTLDYNTTSYSYNAKNQLTQTQTDSDTITYSYNQKGIRTAKSTNTNTTQYIIDSNRAYAQVLQEIQDDTTTVDYTYGHDLLSQTRANKTHHYHYDGLGSARFLSDTNGTLTDSYNYEAFGKLLNQEGNTTNNYKFTGEQQDEETNNYYLRARYFNPTTGGFTQQDSYMGNSQDPITLHKYLYANGNPVSNVDPTGYFSMMSMSGAMGIANTLRTGQTEAYSQFANVISGGWDGVSWDNLPEIAATAVGIRLLFRFNSKLNKACKNSFDGSTLVATENGLIPIENIKIGDKVWAYNESNQTKSLQEVTHLIKGEGTKELVDIKLESGEVITATSNHPFWEIERQEWVDAGKLVLDSVLLDINATNATISALRSYARDATVYNLTVGNDHTYFVGVDGVLGHNDRGIECPITNKILDDVLVGATKKPGNQNLSIYYKSGGFFSVLSDFNKVPMTVVKDYIEKKNGITKGRIIIGKILGSKKPSGEGLVTIIAREFSSTGHPTLEFQISNKKNFHIKY